MFATANRTTAVQAVRYLAAFDVFRRIAEELFLDDPHAYNFISFAELSAENDFMPGRPFSSS